MTHKTERRENNNTPNPEFPRQRICSFSESDVTHYSQLAKKRISKIVSPSILVFYIHANTGNTQKVCLSKLPLQIIERYTLQRFTVSYQSENIR